MGGEKLIKRFSVKTHNQSEIIFKRIMKLFWNIDMGPVRSPLSEPPEEVWEKTVKKLEVGNFKNLICQN